MNERSQSKITGLIIRSKIADVMNSYFRALDEKRFDMQHLAAFLANDAKMTRPHGVPLTHYFL